MIVRRHDKLGVEVRTVSGSDFVDFVVFLPFNSLAILLSTV